MLEIDPERLGANVAAADTEDLLDRVTAYRAGMEAAALEIIETELRRRGVTADDIARHEKICRAECLYDPGDTALMCSLCRRPAVVERLGWHRLFQRVPLFRRRFRYCAGHDPGTAT